MEFYINPVEIAITAMVPSSGAVPQNAVDPTSSISYQVWELNDQAGFNFQVPQGYPTGTDFVLKIWEATNGVSGVSGNHQWGASVVLVQPGVNIFGAATLSEDFSGQFMAPTTSGQMVVSELTITNSGQIDSTPIQADDMISVLLTRIAASSGEDPSSIYVGNMTVAVDIPLTTSVCAGDIGWVIDSVRDQFEGADSGFMTNAFIIRQINEASQVMAINGVWAKDTWVNLYSGSGDYPLLNHIPDFVEPLACVFSGSTVPLEPFGSYDEYWNYMIANSDPTGDPTRVLIQGSTMRLAPIPDASVSSGVRVSHFYLPDDISCLSTTLPVAKSFRNVYSEFVLHRAYERDSEADEYKAKKSQQHYNMFEKRCGDLVSAHEPLVMTTRPG